MSGLPIVCIPCNRVEYQKASSHLVKHQYVRPLLEIVKCIPLLIPAIGKDFDLKSIAGKIDGLLLTGSSSHVCPSNYNTERTFDEHELDIDRDETTLPLIRTAIEIDMPLFAICRGFQEMNVACGGTLHQHIHNLPGKLDHRGDYSLPVKEQYEVQKHKICTQKGGLFERLGLPAEFTANSLHQQGVNKLAPSLFAEGISEDGLAEAVSMPKKRFVLGTQWHPEGDFWLNPSSVKIFEGFAKALRGK
ncbi:MAG: gamma-glutamyl-gamma-aminobutyrate hydrolase family protein [Proteobacteria bacterium]|nr:gamma-glutamyl-gamma-aminobutyrate hydrolase family protein [Pseudomonadota bacterium]